MINIPLQHNRANQYAFYLLLAAIFSIPISTALLNLFFVLSIALTLFNPTILKTIKTSWNNPVSRYTAFLFLLFLLGATWSIGESSEIRESINKYSKFILILLLIPYFIAQKNREKAINAFLYGTSFTLTLIYAIHLGLIEPVQTTIGESLRIRITVDGGFKTHIITAILMGFSGFILLNRYWSSREKKPFWLIGATLFFYYTLFISTGTSGQILTLLLISTAIFLYFKKRSLFIIPVVLLFIGGYGYLTHSSLHHGMERIEQGTSNYQNSDTSGSVSERLHQFIASIDLIAQRPWIGYGTGGTRQAFRNHLPDDTVINQRENVYHPHSEYPLIAIQLGLVGLLAFIGLYLYQLFLLKRINDQGMRNLAAGFTALMIVGNLGNPMIYSSGEGHFWLIFTAILFANLTNREIREEQELS